MPSKKKKFNARFPPARIKKIMQKDEDVGKVAAAVPVIISRALELFIESLILKSSETTQSRSAKTLSTAHIKHTILSEKKFDFLKDLVENIPDVKPVDEDGETPGPSNPQPQASTGPRPRGRPRKRALEEGVSARPPKRTYRKKSQEQDSSATEDADTDICEEDIDEEDDGEHWPPKTIPPQVSSDESTSSIPVPLVLAADTSQDASPASDTESNDGPPLDVGSESAEPAHDSPGQPSPVSAAPLVATPSSGRSDANTDLSPVLSNPESTTPSPCPKPNLDANLSPMPPEPPTTTPSPCPRPRTDAHLATMSPTPHGPLPTTPSPCQQVGVDSNLSTMSPMPHGPPPTMPPSPCPRPRLDVDVAMSPQHGYHSPLPPKPPLPVYHPLGDSSGPLDLSRSSPSAQQSAVTPHPPSTASSHSPGFYIPQSGRPMGENMIHRSEHDNEGIKNIPQGIHLHEQDYHQMQPMNRTNHTMLDKSAAQNMTRPQMTEGHMPMRPFGARPQFPLDPRLLHPSLLPTTTHGMMPHMPPFGMMQQGFPCGPHMAGMPPFMMPSMPMPGLATEADVKHMMAHQSVYGLPMGRPMGHRAPGLPTPPAAPARQHPPPPTSRASPEDDYDS